MVSKQDQDESNGHNVGERVDRHGGHAGPHHPDTSLAGVVGAYDWLFDPVADFPSGGDELYDHSVGGEEDHHGALDPSSELAFAALSFATSTAVAGKRKSVRRKRPVGAAAPWHDFFLLEEELFACEVAFDQVQAALTGEPWAHRWLMSADAPSRAGVPPRPLVLEIFEARDYVLQTRVAYEMWRHGTTALQRNDPAGAYPITPLSRRFLFEITGVMADHNIFDDPGHFVIVADIARANPGIREDELTRLFSVQVEGESALDIAGIVGRALSYMGLEHLVSQSAAGGWYFTGRNPIAKREEIIEDRKSHGYGSINRSWSQWF